MQIVYRETTTLRTHQGPGKRGHIVVDTLLLAMFLGLCKLGNICCGHEMFLNKIRNIFCVRTQYLCPQQMLRTWANGETFVLATMCPQQCVLVCKGLYVHVVLNDVICPQIVYDIILYARYFLLVKFCSQVLL